jgi:hypothetical protein
MVVRKFGSERTAIVFIPVKSVTVADPPRVNILETTIFVANPKKRKMA